MVTKDELIEQANADATASPHRVSILYGDHGKRKTVSACSMVKERGLLLSSDDSWKVLLNTRHKEVFDKLHIVRLEGLSQLDYINFDGYDTVVWDTFGASVDKYTDLLYDEGTWTKNYREKISSTHPELKNVEILAAMDYRVTRDIFRPYMNKMFDLPVHWVFTSQWNEPMKGLSPDMTRRPNVPAATFKIIATRADIIACLRPGSGNKFIADVTENSVAFLGKSRIEGIQGSMDLDKFISTYKEIVFK